MSCAVYKAAREFTVGLLWLIAVVAAFTLPPLAGLLLGILFDEATAFLFFMVGLVAGCNLAAYLNGDW